MAKLNSKITKKIDVLVEMAKLVKEYDMPNVHECMFLSLIANAIGLENLSKYNAHSGKVTNGNIIDKLSREMNFSLPYEGEILFFNFIGEEI